MGTIDNLIIKAKDLASAAGSKAQEVAEQTKVRVQAAQLKNDIDANYLKLGEIIYELRKSGAENEELINMCVEEISSQLAELDELNGRLDEMKRVLRCPECMKENPLDALYCQRCGRRRPRPRKRRRRPPGIPPRNKKTMKKGGDSFRISAFLIALAGLPPGGREGMPGPAPAGGPISCPPKK